LKGVYAGLDVSTQSTKLLIIDLARRAPVHQDQVNFDRDLPEYGTRDGVSSDPLTGKSESNPQMWLDSIELLFRRLSSSLGLARSIRAISVSGQQHGLVAMTKEGELARPYSKLWNDFSTEDECRILNEQVGGVREMIREISNTQRTGYTAAKILHMKRHEPEIYQKTSTFLLVHNFINWYLTGGKDRGIAVMEPGDASGTALWNPNTKDWSDRVLDSIDPGLKSRLPPVRPSRELIGRISRALAERYGFPRNCMIASGSGDNMMAALGTGNFKEGVVTVSLGTSGTAYTFMREPFVDVEGEIASFCDATGYYLPLVCISNMANGYNEILEQFSLSHDDFDSVVRKTRPGNEGRVLCPWYVGERTPDLPSASPVYFGFGLRDFTPPILARAVLEGHIMNLYQGFSRLPVGPKEVRLTGGMAASQAWRETIANVFNSEVVLVKGETAALGAAIHAAWSHQPNLELEEVVDSLVKIDESLRIIPDAELVKLYTDFGKLYSAVSRAIRGLSGPNPFELRREFLLAHFK